MDVIHLHVKQAGIGIGIGEADSELCSLLTIVIFWLRFLFGVRIVRHPGWQNFEGS